MRRLIFGILPAILLMPVAILVSGCAIEPVQYASTPDARCSAMSYRVAIDPPSDGLFEDALTERILDAYRAEPLSPPAGLTALAEAEPISPSMLFLSGGSQNGAFGAGLLSAWARARPAGLPRFRVVTGISTGSLQATFAFLDRSDEIVRRYAIGREGEVLRPFVATGVKGSGGWMGKLSAARAVVRKGAVASLEPLRAQLRDLITDDLLRTVAAEGRAGRLLLVAAVEMDSGDAMVFDLTRIAGAYVGDRAGGEPDEAMRDCYVEALLASSSVPIAALPVFIDGRMYIDGGARFGVISDRLGEAFGTIAADLPPGRPRNLFVIVNGTMETGRLCHLKDCPDADAEGAAPAVPAGPAHASWRFPDLAFRSVGILINQSYRSSVYWSTEEARKRGFAPHFARIEGDLGRHEAAVGLGPEPEARRTCAEWKAIDRRLDAPLEFHPRFMRCLIDYGRSRPEGPRWAALE